MLRPSPAASSTGPHIFLTEPWEAAGLGLSMVGVVTTIGAGVGVGSGVYMLSNREV
jgi:hypothetical protein